MGNNCLKRNPSQASLPLPSVRVEPSKAGSGLFALLPQPKNKPARPKAVVPIRPTPDAAAAVRKPLASTSVQTISNQAASERWDLYLTGLPTQLRRNLGAASQPTLILMTRKTCLGWVPLQTVISQHLRPLSESNSKW